MSAAAYRDMMRRHGLKSFEDAVAILASPDSMELVNRTAIACRNRQERDKWLVLTDFRMEYAKIVDDREYSETPQSNGRGAFYIEFLWTGTWAK